MSQKLESVSPKWATSERRSQIGRSSTQLAFAVFCVVAFISTASAQPGGFGRRGFGGPPGFGGPDSDGSGEKIALEDLTFDLGVAKIPDRDTFEKLSYQGPMRMDGYLSGLEFVKFILTNATTEDSEMYWMNTENYQAHPHFMGRIGMRGFRGGRGGRGRGGNEGSSSSGPTMRGALTYLPRMIAPNGTPGLYIFDFQPNDRFSFEEIKFANDAILETMPCAKGKLAYHPFRKSDIERESDDYAKSGIAIHFDEGLFGDLGFLPLNMAKSYGRLRLMDNDTRPSPRDIVLCKTLPNQMPRVAGVISAQRQTPLSHVNLRAVQDKVPNAFVINATESEQIRPLLGKFVCYEVNSQGYKLREATKAEVDQHFASIRPSQPQSLQRDLSQQEIKQLSQIKFTDSSSFGVKAANIATMHSFEFPDGMVPNGFAVPFYFYDEFMKHNDFHKLIGNLLEREDFQQDREVQRRELSALRKVIKRGNMPEWMMSKLAETHATFPAGTSLRCRSSTNNEDLPGFSGAGLYDSYTHRTDEGHLSKSIKQVFASLWNFRAFEEREFYRVDHMQAAMGVLIHPNYSNELANGVAVTDDILYETQGNYYLNTQVGEDLVTNPDANSSPEEVLLGWWEEDGHEVVRKTSSGEVLLTNKQLADLRTRLARVHARFRDLYAKTDRDQFAMEIEFKITANGKLVIKQARPWVY